MVQVAHERRASCGKLLKVNKSCLLSTLNKKKRSPFETANLDYVIKLGISKVAVWSSSFSWLAIPIENRKPRKPPKGGTPNLEEEAPEEE
jgi:hypothetical protein